MRAAGMTHARVTVLPAGLLARAMLLPDWLISRMARSMATMDPGARSSTLQDLDRGRATEIDHLNGAIVALSQRCAEPAPLNRAVTRIVKNHELAVLSGERPAFLTAHELRSRLELLGHGSVMGPARRLPLA
jgi:2-dehydropantoate 2-reductase